MFQEIGTDSENEVIILTGTGDVWFDSHPSLAVPVTSIDETIQIFYDSVKEMENLIFGIDVPTIVAVNGPAPGHSQIAIACDITLCSDRTVFVDPHFLSGRPPGDGLGLTYQELMGTKRAAYNLYTSQLIDAQAALDLGLVSEVVPHDQLSDRAWTIGRDDHATTLVLPVVLRMRSSADRGSSGSSVTSAFSSCTSSGGIASIPCMHLRTTPRRCSMATFPMAPNGWRQSTAPANAATTERPSKPDPDLQKKKKKKKKNE